MSILTCMEGSSKSAFEIASSSNERGNNNTSNDTSNNI